MDGQGPTCVLTKGSPISSAFDKMDEQVARLNENLTQLESRLADISAPSEQSSCKEQETPTPPCPMQNRIDCITERIGSKATFIQTLIERLQI